MRLGIDFDNTIANYEGAFLDAARERKLIPAETEIARSKSAVKDYFCSRDRESDWTELQGFVYGPGITNATPYEGLIPFLEAMKSEAGVSIVIVSHKTKAPYAGPRYDLHQAAQSWLEHNGIAKLVDSIFFEVTKEAKLHRVQTEGVECFIDDLPSILEHPEFPEGTRRILFDPEGRFEAAPYRRLLNWSEAGEILCDKG